jgi:acyl carrier protein
VHDRINSVIKSVFDLNDSEARQDLAKEEVPKWDSLTHMDLITSIEKTFSIQLTLNDIVLMTSLDSIRAIVCGKIDHHGQ